jgi:hypothetical protein
VNTESYRVQDTWPMNRATSVFFASLQASALLTGRLLLLRLPL